MMKKTLLFLFALLAFARVSAQIRGNNIMVTVTLDHKDWTYETGEKATFVVNVLKSKRIFH